MQRWHHRLDAAGYPYAGSGEEGHGLFRQLHRTPSNGGRTPVTAGVHTGPTPLRQFTTMLGIDLQV